jgi:hypothetical protein
MSLKQLISRACLLIALTLTGCGRFQSAASRDCTEGSASAFFNDILDVQHEASRAAQGLHFAVLSAAKEPALLCDSGPQQAVRISQRSTVGSRRFIARASASGTASHLKAIAYEDPHAGEIKPLADRQLTAVEWSNLWSTIADVDLTQLRVIPVPGPRPEASLDGESTLFEIRDGDEYYVAVRGTGNMEPQLDRLLSALLDLSGHRERSPRGVR